MANSILKEKRVFISYQFGNEEDFITRVCYYLKKQEGISIYFHKEAPIPKTVYKWREEIYQSINDANYLVYFYGSIPDGIRKEELDEAIKIGKHTIFVVMPTVKVTQEYENDAIRQIMVKNLDDEGALDCAHGLSNAILGVWIPEDDIPDGSIFNYEKEIIDAYLSEKIDLNLISQGCPKSWPGVHKQETEKDSPSYKNDVQNPLNDNDIYRDKKEDNPHVIVASLSQYSPNSLIKLNMTFPLAGPRRIIHFDSKNLQKVGILVSGGIAPGINAVISAILERHLLYAGQGDYSVEFMGFLDGFKSLITGRDPIPLDPKQFKTIANQGGSYLGTSRMPEFMTGSRSEKYKFFENAADALRIRHINILYVIGGDGSMRAGHALWKALGDYRENISIVTIPKTMDNDVLWGWQTFGFESAVERADEFIHQLHVEAVSNPRLCILQLFGSDSGYIVTHATLAASGICDLFLIPEVPFTMQRIVEYMKKKIHLRHFDIRNHIDIRDRGRAYGMVLMAETSIPLDAKRYIDDVGLTNEEKTAVLDYLKLDYFQKKPFQMDISAYHKLCDYIGLDNSKKSCFTECFESREWKKISEALYNHSERLRTFGQTPDTLRSAGLKLVSKVLEKELNAKYQELRVFTNEPRHLLRSLSPRSSDLLLGQRLGTLAVDCAMAGYTDFMISQWLTEYVMVPLRLVVLGRKRVPKTGIFYKSAIASTGQPETLV